MPSIISDFEYDIFISYRHNDNRSGGVTEFVELLKSELAATIKEPLSIYFDTNPHDGLLENHHVDKSLEAKLNSLIFIPIISQTYCDLKGFAWQNEFCAFNKLAKEDRFGRDIKLSNGNVASRILPVKIHDLDQEDTNTIEKEIAGVLRAIDFIYKEPGVNRPLKVTDQKTDNQNETDYGNQLNKVANAIKEIIAGLKSEAKAVNEFDKHTPDQIEKDNPDRKKPDSNWNIAKQRNIPRVALAYLAVGILLLQLFEIADHYAVLPPWSFLVFSLTLLAGLPLAIILAWKFEKSPTGFISTQSAAASANPFSPAQKKPFSNNRSILLFIILIGIASLGTRYYLLDVIKDEEASIAIIPFRNYTGKADLDYFGLGLANEIRTQLSLSKRFKNISSEQSTLKYYDSDEDPVDIGEALNAKYLILGSFQMSGEQVKVSMEMVNTSDGRSELQFPPFYTRLNTYTEVFNIQNDIAAKVLTKFAQDEIETNPAPTTSIRAFTYVGQGKEALNKGWFNDDDVFTAIDYFEQAIRIDSTYLSAWVGLIGAKLKYLWAIDQRYYPYSRKDINLQDIEADLAFVDGNFNETWETNYIKGLYYYNGLFDYDRGLEYFLKALDENPEEKDILDNVSAIFRRKLQMERALKYRLKTIEINPLDPSNWNELSYIFRFNGEYENERKALYRAWELGGDTEESFNRIYQFHRLTQNLSALPEEIKQDRPKRYEVDKLLEERNWEKLLSIGLYDTSRNEGSKQWITMNAYAGLGQLDSAKFYAERAIESDRSVAVANAILGNTGIALDSISHWRQKNIQAGDKVIEGLHYMRKIRIYNWANDYEKATTALEEMNKTLPNYGNYSFLNDPYFDRIRTEYPPFVEAMNMLKLPTKLGGINPMDL